MKLKFKANLGSIVKATSIIANSTVLAINTYTFGKNMSDHIKQRKVERIQTNLELLATMAQAASSLADSVSSSIEKGRTS